MFSNDNQRVRYYIYGHYTEDTNILFYVGKGKILNCTTTKVISRYARAYHFNNRNNYWNNVYNKHGTIVKILYEFVEEQECFDKEVELIKLHGRRINSGTLCNMSDGGEIGPIGRSFKMSEKQKKLLSDIRSITLYVYNSGGIFIDKIKTIQKTAKFCGVTYNAIHSCLQTKNYSNGYFIFETYKGDNIGYTVDDLNFKSTLSKKVVSVSIDNNTITHDSVADCSKYLNISRVSIRKAIKLRRLCNKHRVYFEGTISSQAVDVSTEGSETMEKSSTPKQVETANTVVVNSEDIVQTI